MDIVQAGQIPKRLCFIRKIVRKVPDRSGDTLPFIARGFRNFKTGGKCAAIQKLLHALRRIRPTDDLGRTEIASSIPACNVDSIVPIPCGKPAVFRNQTVAAIAKRFQKCRAIFYGLLLGELRDNFHPCFIRIAACAQEVIHLILRNEHRKSGGLNALRVVDLRDLSFFRWEEAQLDRLV